MLPFSIVLIYRSIFNRKFVALSTKITWSSKWLVLFIIFRKLIKFNIAKTSFNFRARKIDRIFASRQNENVKIWKLFSRRFTLRYLSFNLLLFMEFPHTFSRRFLTSIYCTPSTRAQLNNRKLSRKINIYTDILQIHNVENL